MSATTFAPRLADKGAVRGRSQAASQTEACLPKSRLSMMGRFLRALYKGLERRAAIRALGALDERMLADIGIERSHIEAETDAMLARAERCEG